MKLFTLFGVDVFLDPTLYILVGAISVIHMFTAGFLAGLALIPLFIAVYALVLFHEFAHSLTAKHFGFVTKKITLFALGGAAEIEMETMSPRETMIVSIAGPLSNIFLAVVFITFAAMTNLFTILGIQEFIGTIIAFNIVMAVFNLLPAFPMDGGRILHAFLYKIMGNAERVGTICISVTYALSGMGAIAGLIYGQFMLLLVCIFLAVIAKKSIMQVSYGRN